MEVEKDQHFLISSSAIKLLIKGLEISENDKILEIGSGSGNITKLLVKEGILVTASEIDLKFKPLLEEIKKENSNLSLIFKNVLDIDWKSYNKIIGNIPFSAIESIIQKSIDSRISILSLIISDSIKETLASESKLALITNLFFNIKIAVQVEPKNFSPSPKTNCWIAQLKRKEPISTNEKILRDILTKNGKTRNALIYSLVKSGKTKNQAKDIIKKMSFNEEVLNKSVKRASGHFIIKLRSELELI